MSRPGVVPKPRASWQAVVAIVAVAAIASACDPIADYVAQQQWEQDSTHADSMDRSSCYAQVPTTLQSDKRTLAVQDCSRRARILRTVSVDLQYAAEMMASIPEYHDEQRLPDGNGGYGPPAYIFASPNIGGFEHTWQLDEHGTRGALWMIVVVDTVSTAALPGIYRDLGLQPGGRNCVWLARTNGSLRARVTHQLDRTMPCSPTAASRPLHVVQDPLGAVVAAADQPAAARFTESRAGRPLLGARCLLTWCDFGPPPATETGGPGWEPAQVQLVGGPPNATSRPQERVKGWHDSQVLSIGQGASLRPGGPRATFVPAQGIASRSMEFYRGVTFHPVGTLHVLGPVTGTPYDTWGLRPGRNTLSLRLDSNGAWQMQIASPQFSKVWNNVHRHDHHDAAVPGPARFRWISYDDGFWVPCGQGCCRADGVY